MPPNGLPPHMIISVPVQTAVGHIRPAIGAGAVIRQVPVAGLNAAPTALGVTPHVIISVPDHTAVGHRGESAGAGGSVTIVSGATSVNSCVWPVEIAVGGAVGVVDGAGVVAGSVAGDESTVSNEVVVSSGLAVAGVVGAGAVVDASSALGVSLLHALAPTANVQTTTTTPLISARYHSAIARRAES